MIIKINDNDDTVVVQYLRVQGQFFFFIKIFYTKIKHTSISTPKKHNKALKLGDICPDKIADKKNNQ